MRPPCKDPEVRSLLTSALMTLRRDVSAIFQSRRDEPWDGLTRTSATSLRLRTYGGFLFPGYQVTYGDPGRRILSPKYLRRIPSQDPRISVTGSKGLAESMEHLRAASSGPERSIDDRAHYCETRSGLWDETISIALWSKGERVEGAGSRRS